MIRFNSDYTEGAHPEILEALIRTNELQSDLYIEFNIVIEDLSCAKKGFRFLGFPTIPMLILLSNLF